LIKSFQCTFLLDIYLSLFSRDFIHYNEIISVWSGTIQSRTWICATRNVDVIAVVAVVVIAVVVLLSLVEHISLIETLLTTVIRVGLVVQVGILKSLIAPLRVLIGLVILGHHHVVCGRRCLAVTALCFVGCAILYQTVEVVLHSLRSSSHRRRAICHRQQATSLDLS